MSCALYTAGIILKYKSLNELLVPAPCRAIYPMHSLTCTDGKSLLKCSISPPEAEISDMKYLCGTRVGLSGEP